VTVMKRVGTKRFKHPHPRDEVEEEEKLKPRVKPVNSRHPISELSHSLLVRGWRVGHLVSPHANSAPRITSDRDLQFGQNISRTPGGALSYMMMIYRRSRRASYNSLMTRQTTL